MKNRILILFSVLLMMFSAGCATSARTKQYDAAVKGIYQVNQSLKAGRVDLAQKYSNELIRLVPPPKKLDVVKPIETKAADGTTQKYVILPQEYNGTPALSIGTKPFEDVVAANPTLQKQLVEEEKTTNKFSEQVNDAVRAVNKEAEQKEKPKSFFSWMLGLTGFLGVGGIVGVVLVCIFFPAAIPIVVGVFRTVIGWGNGLLSWIATVFRKK